MKQSKIVKARAATALPLSKEKSNFVMKEESRSINIPIIALFPILTEKIHSIFSEDQIFSLTVLCSTREQFHEKMQKFSFYEQSTSDDFSL